MVVEGWWMLAELVERKNGFFVITLISETVQFLKLKYVDSLGGFKNTHIQFGFLVQFFFFFFTLCIIVMRCSFSMPRSMFILLMICMYTVIISSFYSANRDIKSIHVRRKHITWKILRFRTALDHAPNWQEFN